MGNEKLETLRKQIRDRIDAGKTLRRAVTAEPLVPPALTETALMDPFRVKIAVVRHDAILPKYAHDGDAGMDLYACFDEPDMEGTISVILRPGELRKLSTGVAMEIPYGFEGQIRPRSGLSSKGIVAITGTIDSTYRGEIWVTLINHSEQAYNVSLHDRIAQIVFAKCERAELVVVDAKEMSETARGVGGFGSTGR